MGQSSRKASANASLGRESTLINSPSRSSQITAEKVSSLSSLTTILRKPVPNPSSWLLSTSCVMGRADQLCVTPNLNGSLLLLYDRQPALLLLLSYAALHRQRGCIRTGRILKAEQGIVLHLVQ